MSSHLRNFIDVTRLNKPIGFMLLFWPCSWGLAYAFSLKQNVTLFLIRFGIDFDQFLIDFGLQNRSKIDPKTMPKNTLFGIAFLITLGSIFGGFGGPKRGNSSLLFQSF